VRKVSVKRNAVLNVIKQLCSILFPLITYPYISRVLGSEKYGMYSFSDSIVSYFVLIAGLGINSYAVREGSKIRDDRKKIDSFTSELFTINIISTLFAYIGLFLIATFSAHVHKYSSIIYTRALIIILTTIGIDWINNIFEDFTYITIRYVGFQVISLCLMFAFVRSPMDIIPYTFITVIAAAGGNILNLFYIRRYVHVKFKFTNIAKHLPPILILFANNVAITIYVNADITMLGYFSTDSNVGIYALSSKIYNLTKLMINAVITVCIPRLAYLIGSKKEYISELQKIFSTLTLFTLPIIAGLASLSKQIMLIVGGPQYVTGSGALSILSLAIVGAIGGSFFSNCVLLQNCEEKNILKATIIAAVLNILLNFYFIPTWGINGAAMTTVLAEFVACVVEFWFAKKYVPIKELMRRDQLFIVIGSIAVILICTLAKKFIANDIICVIVAILVSIPTYVLINRNNAFLKSTIAKFTR
jgi:O-antigen/teichoic acid export membrane protein